MVDVHRRGSVSIYLLSLYECLYVFVSRAQTSSRYSWLWAQIPSILSHMGWSLSYQTHTHTEHTQSYRAGIRVLYDCTTTYPSPRPLCLSPSLSFSFSLSLFHTPTYKHSHSVETTSVRGYIREVRGRSWQREECIAFHNRSSPSTDLSLMAAVSRCVIIAAYPSDPLIMDIYFRKHSPREKRGC